MADESDRERLAREVIRLTNSLKALTVALVLIGLVQIGLMIFGKR